MFSLLSQFIFGTNQAVWSAKSLLAGGSNWSELGSTGSNTWKDKSLCFDLKNADLHIECGEQLLAAFFPIEDVKGNQEELGVLKITNLRLIWIRCDRKRVNLSIGWRSVSLIFEQNLKDSQGLAAPSLCVIAKHGSSKYEFIFSKIKAFSETVWSSQDESWRVFTELKRLYKLEKHITIDHLTPMYLADPYDIVQKVWTAYKRTGLFRHCRSNLTHLVVKTSMSQVIEGRNGEINRLPSEEVIDGYRDVAIDETRGTKALGTMILTNIRALWIDDSLPLKNLSIPYIRIESMKLRHGDRISISTYDYIATSMKRDFKVQKMESENSGQHLKRCRTLFDQLHSMHAMAKSSPKFGPESCDECLDCMSILKPVEHFLSALDDPTRLLSSDSSQPLNRIIEVNDAKLERMLTSQPRNSLVDLESMTDVNENELDSYKGNLIKYLDERPANGDVELMYSKELGLTIEKPPDGVGLDDLWRMDS